MGKVYVLASFDIVDRQGMNVLCGLYDRGNNKMSVAK